MTKDWKWAFYVLIWLSAPTLILMLTLPETFAPVVLANKAKRIRRANVPGYENVQAPAEASDRTAGDVFRVALTRPVSNFDPRLSHKVYDMSD